MKAKRLRNSEQYSRIFIAKDQSKEEREKQKNLRLELKELRETEGEWYTIKKGKIVKESEARGRGIYRGGYRGRWRRGGIWIEGREREERRMKEYGKGKEKRRMKRKKQ